MASIKQSCCLVLNIIAACRITFIAAIFCFYLQLLAPKHPEDR